MADNTTQIREARNNVKIEGIVKEIRLEEKNDVISGDLIIQTGGKSEHSVYAYAKRLTKSGAENKSYKGLQTVLNEFVSVASLMKNGRSHEEAAAEATKVRINNAKLDRQEFYRPSGEFISSPRMSANYFNRVMDESFSPKAEFEIECYFNKIRKEITGDEETGRLIVEGIIPLYGGRVIPMDFVAEGDVADYIENHYETKKTGLIWGDVVNQVERTVVKKSGFGKDKEEVKVNYKRELLITGGNEEQYEEDSTKAYTTGQIQAAWKVRETETLPAMLKKSQDKDRANGVSAKSDVPDFKF